FLISSINFLPRVLLCFPTRRSSDLAPGTRLLRRGLGQPRGRPVLHQLDQPDARTGQRRLRRALLSSASTLPTKRKEGRGATRNRSERQTHELQSHAKFLCRRLLDKK